MRYVTHYATIGEGYVIKKRGEPPVLVCNSMEREEGANSGLRVETYHDYRLIDLIGEEGSVVGGRMRFVAEIFKRHQVAGKVAFYGREEPAAAYQILARIGELAPGVSVFENAAYSLIDEACMTKDAAEIAALKDVARRSNAVMGEVVSFIQGHQVKGERWSRPMARR